MSQATLYNLRHQAIFNFQGVPPTTHCWGRYGRRLAIRSAPLLRVGLRQLAALLPALTQYPKNTWI